MEKPDYFPRPDRRRSFYKDKNLEILVLSEQINGMWRPRYSYTLVIGRRQYSNSGVYHNSLFGTPEQCHKFAHEVTAENLERNFTWNDQMRTIREQLMPFRNTLLNLGIDTRNYKIWQ